MSYSYAKRSFPRRRPSSGGGAGGWLAVMVLTVAIGALWWAKGLPQTGKKPEDITIIPSSAAINNNEQEERQTSAAAQEEEIDLTLHLEGFTLWGVQKGIYGTLQAAREAAGDKELLFEAEDGCRVIDSVWGEKERAQTRGEALSGDSYAAQLTARGLNLKLTGSREKLETVERAVQSWESVLEELLEVQTLLEEGGMKQATAQRYVLAVREELQTAAEALPEENEVLKNMKTALADTGAAMEEIINANPEEKVDFAGIFRYNVGISYNIYNHYLEELLLSS